MNLQLRIIDLFMLTVFYLLSNFSCILHLLLPVCPFSISVLSYNQTPFLSEIMKIFLKVSIKQIFICLKSIHNK